MDLTIERTEDYLNTDEQAEDYLRRALRICKAVCDTSEEVRAALPSVIGLIAHKNVQIVKMSPAGLQLPTQ